MQNVSENAGTITSESNECNAKTPVGVEKPWAEMSLEERDAADRKRGFNNEGDRIGGEGVDMGKGIDHTTILVFKLNKGNCDLLHRIMVKRNHLNFSDTLTELIREEVQRATL